nr:hypothetical protein [Bartonella henselae]
MEEEDREKYYQQWAIDTHERIWIDFLLYTGLCCGKAVRIGWKDIKDNIIHLTAEKSKSKKMSFFQFFLN